MIPHVARLVLPRRSFVRPCSRPDRPPAVGRRSGSCIGFGATIDILWEIGEFLLQSDGSSRSPAHLREHDPGPRDGAARAASPVRIRRYRRRSTARPDVSATAVRMARVPDAGSSTVGRDPRIEAAVRRRGNLRSRCRRLVEGVVRGWVHRRSMATASTGWRAGRPKAGARWCVRRPRRLRPATSRRPMSTCGAACTSTAAARTPSTSGDVVYSNWADGRVYARRPTEGGAARHSRPRRPCRYADLDVRPGDGTVFSPSARTTRGPGEAVEHARRDPARWRRAAVADRSSKARTSYAAPRLSPDGTTLAWLTLEPPEHAVGRRPISGWRGSTRRSARGTSQHVAGGAAEWTSQPPWSPRRRRSHFADERSGWLQLYRRVGRIATSCVTPMRRRVRATRTGSFGPRRTPSRPTGRVCAIVRSDGRDRCCAFAPRDGAHRSIDACRSRRSTSCASAAIARCSSVPARRSSPRSSTLDLASGRARGRCDARPSSPRPGGRLRSGARRLRDDGRRHGPRPSTTRRATRASAARHGRAAAARRDVPRRADRAALVGALDLAPAADEPRLRRPDVDYGGSTGYGRDYRERLDGAVGRRRRRRLRERRAGHWPIADSSTATGCAIEGGSASGYTTLCALTFRDVFRAGVSHFGIGDLAALEARHAQVRVALHVVARRAVRAATRSSTGERSPVHSRRSDQLPRR